MTSRPVRPNLRQTVVRAAQEAKVPVGDYERALILGQIAGLLAGHPKVGGRIAFKGGAIMHLVEGSPRLSRDLDGSMVTGGRITEKVVRQALTTPEALRTVKRIDVFTRLGKTGLRFPVIACHPLSGVDEVTVTLSIHWDAPLLLAPEEATVTISGQSVTFLAVARAERLAEKIRAFVDRGLDRDAFDLYHYSIRGASPDQIAGLPGLVEQKLREDRDLAPGTDLHALFDRHLAALASTFGRFGGLTLLQDLPDWSSVEPRVRSFRSCVPATKPG